MQVFACRQPGLLVGIECDQQCTATLHAPSPRQRGFTLVELMVTLAVVVILTAIAIPSFRNLTLSNRLTTTANSIVGALRTARMEAVKRNASVQFCSNDADSNGGDDLGGACDTDTGAVWTVVNGTDTRVQAGIGNLLTGSVQLNDDLQAVRFNAQGLGYSPADATTPLADTTIADICTTSLKTDNHRLVRITAGSIIEVVPTTNATCND